MALLIWCDEFRLKYKTGCFFFCLVINIPSSSTLTFTLFLYHSKVEEDDDDDDDERRRSYRSWAFPQLWRHVCLRAPKGSTKLPPVPPSRLRTHSPLLLPQFFQDERRRGWQLSTVGRFGSSGDLRGVARWCENLSFSRKYYNWVWKFQEKEVWLRRYRD